MQKDSRLDPSSGQFIDPMFAVVIAAAIAETVVAWVKDPSELPSFFSMSVVAIGYINLLLSWFGYHKSVARKPIRGSLRFIITVVLLPMYLLTIILFNTSFHVTVTIYAMIFFLWAVWEYFKGSEYEYEVPKKFWSLQFRFNNVLIYFVFLAQIGYFCFPELFGSFVSQQALDWISLSVIVACVIFLRISKSAEIKDTPARRILTEIKILLFGKRTDEVVHEEAVTEQETD